jgi:hypothetical protein
MSLNWQGGFDFSALEQVRERLPEFLDEGLDAVKDEAVRLAPKEDGDLARSAYKAVLEDFGGLTGIVGFHSNHAAKEHENLYYHHHSGGQPKYEETAIRTKGQDVYDHVAQRIRETL